MRIAVYSGSFNPLHIGHLAIMEYLTASKKFDCVYLVVSPKNLTRKVCRHTVSSLQYAIMLSMLSFMTFRRVS